MNKKDLKDYIIDCDLVTTMSQQDFKKYILILENDVAASSNLLEYYIHKRDKNVYVINLCGQENYTRIKINII